MQRNGHHSTFSIHHNYIKRQFITFYFSTINQNLCYSHDFLFSDGYKYQNSKVHRLLTYQNKVDTHDEAVESSKNK